MHSISAEELETKVPLAKKNDDVLAEEKKGASATTDPKSTQREPIAINHGVKSKA